MTQDQPAISADSYAPRLALFYGGMFVALGIYIPFLPVWLAAKGLDSDAIGLVLAAPMVVRIVAVPLATRAADRWALRGVLIATAVATPIGFALVGLASSFSSILIAMACASAAFTSTFPLADAYALKGLAARGRAYGPVRLWGSAAFIAGSLVAGLVLDWVAPDHLIWAMVAAFLAAAVASFALRPLGAEPAATGQAASARALLRSPAFLAVVAAASLIQASHAVYYGFSTLAWTQAGLDGLKVGGLWALGVVSEIVLFALSGRLPIALAPTALIGIGAAGAVVRWGAMAFDPPAAMLPLLQCLHGLSFGATHLGSVQFLARVAPDRLGATAQGYLAIALGVVMAAAMALSGVLYGAIGGLAYAAMALAALAGGGFALAAHRLRREG